MQTTLVQALSVVDPAQGFTKIMDFVGEITSAAVSVHMHESTPIGGVSQEEPWLINGRCNLVTQPAPDRVASGRCRPEAPTDPYLLALEHTVPQIMGSLPSGTQCCYPFLFR